MKSMQQTILEQLSPAKNGNAIGRLTAMTGAHNFVTLPNGVTSSTSHEHATGWECR